MRSQPQNNRDSAPIDSLFARNDLHVDDIDTGHGAERRHSEGLVPDDRQRSPDLRLTIEDRASKATKTLERKGKVLPADFGIVQVGTTADAEGITAVPPLGTVGQSLFVNFSVVGFERDKARKQPDVEVSMRLLDEQGNPTTTKPLTGSARSGIPDDYKLLPMQFGLTLNRTGKFTVEVSANDKLSNKTAKVSFPIK